MKTLDRIAEALEKLATPRAADDLLSVSDVAAMLHVSEDRVRLAARNGALTAYDLNKGGSRPHYLIKRSAVYDYLDASHEVEKPKRRTKHKQRDDAGDWA